MLYTYGQTPISLYTDRTERIRIRYDGNVGIGTTNPQYKVDINHTSASGYDLHVYNSATKTSFFVGYDALWYGTSKTSGTIFSINKGCSYDGGGGTPVLSVNANGVLAVSGAATFGSSITSSDSIESTGGHIIAYGQIRLSGTGSNYSGLFLNNYITSGGSANDIWLYNPNKVIIFGSSVDVRSALNCSSTIYATTGIWSDGYVSAKGQNTSSDMRLKNVLNDVVLSVKDIANAPSIRFSWKNSGGVDVGSSAQYWQKLLPDAVKERDGMLEMQYANIALLSAIALAKNVETHEERIARLERENKELRNEINVMKGCIYE